MRLLFVYEKAEIDTGPFYYYMNKVADNSTATQVF